jgi:hypothetical protein
MNLRPGRIFLALSLLAFGQCEYKNLQPNVVAFDCTQSTLALTLVSHTDATKCNLIDGSLTVQATGGTAPYDYSLNAGTYETGPIFGNLGPGLYTATVKDANSCMASIQVTISSPNSTLTATPQITPDNECLAPHNGSVTLTPSGGTPPYKFQFGTGAFGTKSSFDSLMHGSYTITVRDSAGCPKAINVVIPRGSTGVSYANDIKPIFDASCAIPGCHNGDNGSSTNWNVFSNVQNNAQQIKIRTQNRSMPLDGTLTQNQIDIIACWVDDGAKNN